MWECYRTTAKLHSSSSVEKNACSYVGLKLLHGIISAELYFAMKLFCFSIYLLLFNYSFIIIFTVCETRDFDNSDYDSVL
jgi:hypothetical protein